MTTLLAVVSFFIFFNLPGIVEIIWELVIFNRLEACRTFDEDIGYSTWDYMVTDVAQLMLVCNSAINFLLYVVFAPRFRMILRRNMRRHCPLGRTEKRRNSIHTIYISKIHDSY